ncbi:hypothetical protein K2Z83_19650 [Oscillochloris sp. ZM17-4]|uniref:hypothetical protein n=1 Tax=Oscillochloris sp. ZM17-4 TaxID=2866714 RepID=UPI001C736002|nr:hypothetical protein [Oscillochloris sp. ZM17-4]MBX0329883.1 hypothetical protein [Oscillochloris sp. ZM17-4]
MAKQKRESLRSLITPAAAETQAPAESAPVQTPIYQLSTSTPPDELPAEAQDLGAQLYELARRYVGARRRSGEALIEAGRWLSEARQIAEEGTWYLFLRITETSEDVAERLLNIHLLASRHPSFEAAIIQGRINQSVAALLARPSTPSDVLDVVLADSAPLSVAAVQRSIKAARHGQQQNHHPVENVDNPLIAGAPANQLNPTATGAQISPDEQATIAQAMRIVLRLTEMRHPISNTDRNALLSLSDALTRLLYESVEKKTQ